MENYLSNIHLLSILVDAALVVLIWMVQLIIYPSFLYYTKTNLLSWHQKYTTQIAIIVIPLMLAQLISAIVFVLHSLNTTHTVSLLIVLFLWIFTFLAFAPLHFKISEGKADQNLLKLLIQRNWIRTFLWSFLLVFHLLI